MFILHFSRALAKIQALLVFCLGFACRQKPNVLECALALFSMAHNGLKIGEGGDFYHKCLCGEQKFD
jgi:hypothetical protein